MTYSALRLLNGFRKPLRDEVMDRLDEIVRNDVTDAITVQHVTRAIGIAFEAYESDFGFTLDLETAKRAEEDIAAGRVIPIQELIDEFRRQCA